MVAQDTGSAIIGPARADLYFGAGEEAGAIAGRIRHQGRFVMLMPRELDLVEAGRQMPLPRPRPATRPRRKQAEAKADRPRRDKSEAASRADKPRPSQGEAEVGTRKTKHAGKRVRSRPAKSKRSS